MAVELKRHRFTVDDYYRMAEAGILDEDSRVELIEGEIVEMAPIGSEHSGSVDQLAAVFFRRFGDRAQVRVQNPIRLGRYNEPEPDLALLRPRDDFYRASHPMPEDVLLVVEVADASLRTDRAVKVPLYARVGVVEVWLVDLPNAAIHVYREPAPDGYRVVQTLRRGDRLTPWAFPDQELEVTELLGAGDDLDG